MSGPGLGRGSGPTIHPGHPLPYPIYGGYHVDLLAPGTVTFVLYAPFKPYVSLVGDFNGWNSRAHIMTTDGRGLWWITLPHPGATRYGFYVAVDAQSHVWVGDPYATEVRWDETGPWAYLPGPERLARRARFPWTDREWRTPALRDLVIYELCVRDFTGHWAQDRPVYGTFRGVEAKLDYLVDLGVNAVELMPLHQFPGESSWGYNPVFYCAPAHTYGTPEDLMRLVDACHRRGIAVILDVVFNHAWGDHPYYQFYPPMYGPRGEWLDDWNPFFHHTPPEVNSWGGVDWDHFVPETTRYFQDVVRFLLREFHVDGFRFDWVCGIEYDSRDPRNPGFNPFHGIQPLCWAARQEKPDVILIGEYWPLSVLHPQKTPARLVADTDMQAVWDGEFHHVLFDVLAQRWAWERRDIFRAIGGFRDRGFTRADQVVHYSCSHDEVRPEHEILFYARRYIQRPQGWTWPEVALAKGLLGLVTLLAAPGVPMLWMGQEFGEDTPRTIDFLPLRWEKLQDPRHRAHRARVRRLIRARRQHACLRSDWIQFYKDDFPATRVVRFRRWDDQGSHAEIALNFGHEPRQVELEFPWDGPWLEVVTGHTHRIRGRRRRFTLGPWSGRLYVGKAS